MRERGGEQREREREREWTKWYSHSYTNISIATVSCLPGQPFRESGQQIGLHLF